MPGNLRKKLKPGGPTEHDYERARKIAIRSSSICGICGEAVDKTLRPICRRVKADGYTVFNAHEIPATCGEDCSPEHGRKAHPWGPGADHIIPVVDLKPGDRRLTDPRNLRICHNACNRRRGADKKTTRYKVSKNYFTE